MQNPIVRLCMTLEKEREILKAQTARVSELESQLVALVGVKDEGSFSVALDDFKVTTTGRVTRSVEPGCFDIRDRIGKDLFDRLFTFKPSLNVKAFKALREANPVAYRVACEVVTSKPAKPGIKVLRTEEAAA